MQTVRQAIRAVRVAPGVATVAVLSLTLGLGATISIFSIIDAFTLRELPVRDPNRLVLITDGTSTRGQVWNFAAWDELRRHSGFVDSLAAWAFSRFNLAASGEARHVDGLSVSGSFFSTVGVPTIVGRPLRPADDLIGGGTDGPVAVVGYRFWQSEFQGRSDVVGQSIVFNDVPFTIVGVTPPYFFGPEPGRRFDVIVPIAYDAAASGTERLDNRGVQWLTVVARLKSEQRIDAAAQSLRGIHPQIRQASMPDTVQSFRELYMRDGFVLTSGATGFTNLRGRFQQPLFIILALVVVVQLIGSANVANILLARAAARRYEFAVRVALGASRWQVTRQLLTESFFLAAVSAVGGIGISRWGAPVLVQQMVIQTGPVVLDLALDWRVLAFAVSMTAATALIFGLAPAVRAFRADPLDALNARGRTASPRSNWLTAGAVIAQVALSITVLAAAALFVRTLTSLSTREGAFVSDRVLLVRMDAPRGLSDAHPRLVLYERVCEAVQQLPDVAAATLSVAAPGGTTVVRVPVQVSQGNQLSSAERITWANLISPAWFRVFSVPVVTGRPLTVTDRGEAPPVAVVNQSFARRFLNGADPVGHLVRPDVRMTPQNRPIEIVGVVRDVPYRRLQDPLEPIVYLAIDQVDPAFMARGLASMNLIVRSKAASPRTIGKSVTSAIASVDPTLSFTIRTLADQLSASVAEERVLAFLSAALAGLGLVLTLIGLYGITAYATVQRRKEIAVRLALGATPGGIRRAVIGRVIVLLALGLTGGLMMSLAVSPVVESLLVDISPRDWASFGPAAVIIAATGVLAGFVPARRAARLEPAELLREP